MIPNIHLLFEYGMDSKPHGSGVIRLLRPFSYPSIADKVSIRTAWSYDRSYPADWVIVDRFWHPHDVTLGQVENLVKEVRQSGSRLIYALDDNLLDLPRERFSFQEYHFQIVEYFLKNSDGILVTTPFLKERFSAYHKPTCILRNSLDDRLLLPKNNVKKLRNDVLKIGYMGTLTHKNDIELILPVLKSVVRRHPKVRFEFIGGIAKSDVAHLLSELPITWISPNPGEDSYALFMLWYSRRIQWDIALAPLENTAFNEAKSDIKLLDYAAVGAAGIFSHVNAYQSTIIHSNTGWLAENTADSWEEALETLITNDELRTEIAYNAYQYLYRERILRVNASQWVEMLEFFNQALPAS